MAGIPREEMSVPLGNLEPHAGLLKVPCDEQSLYKMMTVENLLRSIKDRYLHFNRVDSYRDFPGADEHDGEQPPADYEDNRRAAFAKAPHFTAADYYERSRSRTYACCFAMENSDFIWTEHANGSAKGKVCVVFAFGKLRARLNETFLSGSLEFNGQRCHQIFSLNHGLVEYVDRATYQANVERLPNPIVYTYLKDKSFSGEREFRVSLSAIGIGQFVLENGGPMTFPHSLQFHFDLGAAMADGTIAEILCDGASVSGLRNELHCLRIVPAEGCALRPHEA